MYEKQEQWNNEHKRGATMNSISSKINKMRSERNVNDILTVIIVCMQNVSELLKITTDKVSR
jgi:hypothetical protein